MQTERKLPRAKPVPPTSTRLINSRSTRHYDAVECGPKLKMLIPTLRTSGHGFDKNISEHVPDLHHLLPIAALTFLLAMPWWVRAFCAGWPLASLSCMARLTVRKPEPALA